MKNQQQTWKPLFSQALLRVVACTFPSTTHQRCLNWNGQQQFSYDAYGNLVARKTVCGLLLFQVGCRIPYAWGGDITEENTEIQAAVANSLMGDTPPALLSKDSLQVGVTSKQGLISAVIRGKAPGGMSVQDFKCFYGIDVLTGISCTKEEHTKWKQQDRVWEEEVGEEEEEEGEEEEDRQWEEGDEADSNWDTGSNTGSLFNLVMLHELLSNLLLSHLPFHPRNPCTGPRSAPRTTFSINLRLALVSRHRSRRRRGGGGAAGAGAGAAGAGIVWGGYNSFPATGIHGRLPGLVFFSIHIHFFILSNIRLRWQRRRDDSSSNNC